MQAAGVRGTGCYFDDPAHDLLGLGGDEFQDLYHFTEGGPVEDPRFTVRPVYGQLGSRGYGPPAAGCSTLIAAAKAAPDPEGEQQLTGSCSQTVANGLDIGRHWRTTADVRVDANSYAANEIGQ